MKFAAVTTMIAALLLVLASAAFASPHPQAPPGSHHRAKIIPGFYLCFPLDHVCYYVSPSLIDIRMRAHHVSRR